MVRAAAKLQGEEPEMLYQERLTMLQLVDELLSSGGLRAIRSGDLDELSWLLLC